MRNSGGLRQNQYAVHRLLEDHGPLTALAMAALCTLHPKQCHKASTELITLGAAVMIGRSADPDRQLFALKEAP